ncbi:hypothetical protein Poly51_25900 [Rubripirellula tenax]|uniref:Uncharacterized protein n=1 Tax=Rubripirellula tenax TaxID=2528015 RepID=A0A5C6F4K4_9BACT|nr:hypothetical protein [Rubripirellula tenax]TWU56673.1 hypothetical protein Poly51_25900 [Rubripirellula tenax]
MPPLNAYTLSVVMLFTWLTVVSADDLVHIDRGGVRVGVDRGKGAAITWLSWPGHPTNVVNVADPGRLIQQSYYAGASLDRRAEGQSPAWSPWTWNPIQGGGVGSWARVVDAKVTDGVLYSETIPKLWDMPSEEAGAVMRQWTAFEPAMDGVIVVTCQLTCQRDDRDAWGPPKPRHQELPACYFTRRFDQAKSYLGNNQWRDENHPPGPPWGKANPPLAAMACFEPDGQGVAVYSPVSKGHWNFGPHGTGDSDNPSDGPCMHLAPIQSVTLSPKSVFRYRYWIITGDAEALSDRLDQLITLYCKESFELTR